jgi:hypothetical protein
MPSRIRTARDGQLAPKPTHTVFVARDLVDESLDDDLGPVAAPSAAKRHDSVPAPPRMPPEAMEAVQAAFCAYLRRCYPGYNFVPVVDSSDERA